GQYRERYEAVNSRAAPQPIIASFVCCHEDAGMAEEMAHKYIRGYSQSALEHYEFHNEGLADIKGYEYYGALAQNIKKHGMDSFVNFLADLQVWGTPDQVFEKLVEFQQRTDAAGQICAFSFGGMPHDMARDNMKLFAEKVLPRLQAYDAGGTVGSAGDPVTVAAE
ncbi:MAG: LLM class flavin-dependent oxidoreductase, partial [Minwuiales bacterium]|nr:LLM class flavin-dependent oxidoreductase [Minwuiales bacterium]